MELGLAGKQAVVTGGSQGLGRAVARILAEEGCDVILAARGAESLEQAAAEAAEAGGSGVRAVPVAADLTTGEGVDALFAAVDREFGGLDVLVNNAGPVEFTQYTFDDADDDVWQRAMDGLFMSMVRCCQAAVPSLRARGGGAIVNVSAMSIRHQSPRLVTYTAAKAAMASVSKNLAHTLGPDGIRVNTICPGAMLTERMIERSREIDPDADPAEVFRQRVAEAGLHPDLGRVGRPEEIADAVVYLASSRASYITGAMLNVDGGTDF